MGTKVFDNANDLITFSRASGGTALRKIAYGPELVTNGTFDTDTSGWSSFGSGITVSWSNGRLRTVASFSGGSVGVRQVISGLTVGKPYLISAQLWDITQSATNGPTLRWGNGDITSGYTILHYDGTASEDGLVVSGIVVPSQATITVLLVSGGSGGALTSEYDNVSVKEVLFDQGDLTLFNHPAGIPRIEYAADGTVKGLLVEEARTNLITYSEEFDNADWNKNNSTVTANAATAPDGIATAEKLVENTATGVHHLSQTQAVPLSTHTLSVYVKKETRAWVRLSIAGASYASVYGDYTTNRSAYFDLENGVKGTIGSAFAASSIASVGNGWHHISVSFVGANNPDNEHQIGIAPSDLSSVYTGDGTSGIYIYGAQLEAGAFPTSYIPTSGSTVTRAADVASIPVSAFGYNQSGGTVVVDATKSPNVNNGRYVQFSNTSVSSRFSIFQQGETNATGYCVNEGAVTCSLNISTAGIEQIKAGFTFSENDFALCLNGGSVSTDTLGAFPEDIETLFIGKFPNSDAYQLNGHIKSIQYYPRRLTNTQLQLLTNPKVSSLLSAYSGAAAAYSLRDLTGTNLNIVRVRRSSDNAERDFTTKELEYGILTDWVGAGDGFVVTWYDQSGNNNDATQATAASQPKIVSAGVLVTEGGKAALSFDGVDDSFGASLAADSNAYYWSTHSVFKSNSSTAEQVLYCVAPNHTVSNRVFSASLNRESSSSVGSNNVDDSLNNVGAGGDITVSQQNILTHYYFSQTPTASIFVNGDELLLAYTGRGSSGTSAINAIQIGERKDTVSIYWFSGIYQELILYPSDQSTNRVGIETNINDYYGIY